MGNQYDNRIKGINVYVRETQNRCANDVFNVWFLYLTEPMI